MVEGGIGLAAQQFRRAGGRLRCVTPEAVGPDFQIGALHLPLAAGLEG